MNQKISDEHLLKLIVTDDAEGYTTIKEIDHGGSRWHRLISTVFKRDIDDTLFIAEWRQGATEYQDHEWPDVAYEAEEYTVTKVHYRIIPQPKGPAS